MCLNYQRLLAETAMGRDMAAKLQQIRAQVGAEAQSLAPEQQSLAQESQRLNQLRRNRSDEQVRADSDFGAAIPSFGRSALSNSRRVRRVCAATLSAHRR